MRSIDPTVERWQRAFDDVVKAKSEVVRQLEATEAELAEWRAWAETLLARRSLGSAPAPESRPQCVFIAWFGTRCTLSQGHTEPHAAPPEDVLAKVRDVPGSASLPDGHERFYAAEFLRRWALQQEDVGRRGLLANLAYAVVRGEHVRAVVEVPMRPSRSDVPDAATLHGWAAPAQVTSVVLSVAARVAAIAKGISGGSSDPNRCVCAEQEHGRFADTPHRHYEEPPFRCARCHCEAYSPAVAGPPTPVETKP